MNDAAKARELILEGIAHYNAGDLAKAANRFYEALKHDDRSLDAAKRLAITLYMTGNAEEAHQFASLALSLSDKPDPHLLTMLARYIEGDGDIEGAIQALSLAVSQLLKHGVDGKAAKEAYLASTLASYLLRSGRREEAIAIFSRLFKIKLATVDLVANNLKQPRRALFHYHRGRIVHAIGDFCTAIDIFTKARQLGMLPDMEYLLLMHKGMQVNRTMVEYWSRHITVIHDPEEAEKQAKTYKDCEFPPFYVPNGETDGFYFHEAWLEVNRRWMVEKRPPLLELDDEHAAEGRKILQGLGVPEDAWFVCLHVREAGFHMDAGDVLGETRNAPIDDYIPAIERIVASGGWVLRMGDASMTPLAPMDHFIDYALSDAKSERMDVFLCAACRFFIGTNSGLGQAPLNFGVPTIQTNMLPVTYFSTLEKDLYIHRTARREVDDRPLTVKEMFAPPYVDNRNEKAIERLGIEYQPNSPGEIKDVVAEMIESLDGRAVYDEEDEDLHRRYVEACTVRGRHSLGRPGRLFLRNIADLI